MAKIWTQGKERFMCSVCKNEEIELGQKYCQICGEHLEWEEEASAEGLSIDEAINHARETAEKKYLEGFLCYANSGNIENDKKNDECIKCAKEHEQLAEWLEELKKYREMKDQHRWIPVEERLSEKEGVYIVTFAVDEKVRAVGYGCCRKDVLGEDIGFGWYDLYSGTYFSDKAFIAWQPLPEPYQPEE